MAQAKSQSSARHEMQSSGMDQNAATSTSILNLNLLYPLIHVRHFQSFWIWISELNVLILYTLMARHRLIGVIDMEYEYSMHYG